MPDELSVDETLLKTLQENDYKKLEDLLFANPSYLEKVSLTLAKQVIKKYPEIINSRVGGSQYTFFSNALFFKRFDLVNLMLQPIFQADVNAPTNEEDNLNFGITPLYLAVSYKQWGIVKIMLEERFRPDVNARPKNPTHVAYGTTVFFGTLVRNQDELVKQMLKLPIAPDVNAVLLKENHSTFGFTPLLWAVCNKGDIVKIMLEERFIPNVNAGCKNPTNLNYGATVLFMLMRKQDWESVRKVLSSVQNIDFYATCLNNGIPEYKKTMLGFAIAAEQWDIVFMMYLKGVSFYSDEDKLSPEQIKKYKDKIKELNKIRLTIKEVFYSLRNIPFSLLTTSFLNFPRELKDDMAMRYLKTTILKDLPQPILHTMINDLAEISQKEWTIRTAKEALKSFMEKNGIAVATKIKKAETFYKNFIQKKISLLPQIDYKMSDAIIKEIGKQKDITDEILDDVIRGFEPTKAKPKPKPEPEPESGQKLGTGTGTSFLAEMRREILKEKTTEQKKSAKRTNKEIDEGDKSEEAEQHTEKYVKVSS